MFTKLHKTDGVPERFFMIMDDITNETCRQAIEWIIQCNLHEDTEEEPKPELLTLLVSSHGGDVHSAFALIDVMNASSIPIRTIGTGIVASAALFISMAGTPGYRVLSPSTTVMSHHFSTSTEGNRYELMSQIRSYENMHKLILNHYKKCTGLSEDEILNKLLSPTDNYFTAQEAKRLNLCDIVKDLK